MPELPEIETMRRGLAPVLGCKIDAVLRCPTSKKPIVVGPTWRAFQRRVQGRQIMALDRAGKRLVLRLSGDECLVIEPRMTGLVLLSEPPTIEHLRFQFALSHGEATAFWYWDRRGLGILQALRSRDFESRFRDRLGPDALSISVDQLHERLGSSRRPIKVGLLDQRAVAGIGNLYASEILHAAGINPKLRCCHLRPAQWRRLQAATASVLEAAIVHEGSTLADGTYRTALNQAGGYQNHHRVYGRQGAPCATCGRSDVVRIVQAQRSTFFCPLCQSGRNRTTAKGRQGPARKGALE